MVLSREEALGWGQLAVYPGAGAEWEPACSPGPGTATEGASLAALLNSLRMLPGDSMRVRSS